MAGYTLTGAVGGLLCGYLADKLGRRGALMISDLIAILGAVLMGICKITNIYLLLLVGRLISGVSNGLSMSLSAMYLTEIAPLRLRGFFGSINITALACGVLMADILSTSFILGTERLWPLLLALNAVPAVAQLILLPFCPESPKYLLIIKKNQDEAEKALCRLRNSDDIQEEIQAMLPNQEAITESNPSNKAGSFWWGMVICMVNHITLHCSGINAVLYYSQIIFMEQAHMDENQATFATLGIGVTFLASNLLCTVVIERAGRRILLLSGIAVIGLANAMLFLCLHLLALDPLGYKAAAYGAIFSIYLFILAFEIGPSAISWFYTSELFDSAQRGKANTIATITNTLIGFLVVYTFLFLKEALNEYVFLINTGAMVLSFSFLYFFAPETKNRECDDIKKELEKRMPKILFSRIKKVVQWLTQSANIC